jgi:hypothetical protein
MVGHDDARFDPALELKALRRRGYFASFVRDHRLKPIAVGGTAPQIGFKVMDAEIAAGKVLHRDGEIVLLPGEVEAVAREKNHAKQR